MKTKRIDYLDSVRGIAAMMVVIYHFIGWRWSDKNSVHVLSTFFNGSDAVSFFFVLSGFVLSYKYFQTNNPIEFKQYVLKRIFRIYPAYVITVFINYAYWNRHSLGLHNLSDVFYVNSQQLWQELFLVKTDHKFYIPGWTLGVEMALSLLLPILILAARQQIKAIFFLILISFYIGAGHLSMFIFHFCLGLILAYYFTRIQTFQRKQSKLYPYTWVIAFSTWILFSIRHLDRIKPINSHLKQIMAFWNIDFFHLSGLASFIILLYIINNQKIQRFLQTAVLKFLGKISYSIYLTHWLVVVYIMEHWEKWQTVFTNKYVLISSMLFITIGFTILLSTLLYYLIEKPCIHLAKRFV